MPGSEYPAFIVLTLAAAIRTKMAPSMRAIVPGREGASRTFKSQLR